MEYQQAYKLLQKLINWYVNTLIGLMIFTQTHNHNYTEFYYLIQPIMYWLINL